MEQNISERGYRNTQGMPAWVGYAVALVLVGGLTVANHLLDGVFPGVYFRIPYILVIGLIGYVYGIGPAMLAFVLSFLGYNLVYVPPGFSVWPFANSPSDWAQFVIFLIGSIIAAVAMSALRSSNRSLATEVSERRAAQEELSRARDEAEADRARLQAVIASMHDGLVFSDPAGNLTYWNPAAIAMHGFQCLDEVTKPLVDFDKVLALYTTDGRPIPLEDWPLSRVLRGESFSDWGIVITRTDTGMRRVFNYSGAPARNAAGELILAVLTMSDITERKRAEEKQAELASLLDLAHVMILDPERHITYWSMGDERLYGFTREEALGKFTNDFLHTVFPVSAEDTDRHLAEEGHWSGELRHTRHDGDYVYVASHQVLFRDSDGRPTAILEVNNDVTEQKRVEEEFRKLNAELEKRVAERTMELRAANQGLLVANKELEAFSYSVSHDLRAPLRAVDGFSNALQKSYGDQLGERGADYLRRIRAAAQRMGDLIDDLLGLSRATRAEVRRERIDLSQTVREIADELKRSEPNRKAEFIIEPDVWVNADRHLMQIAMRNLLDNAWKFTSTRDVARIEFGTRRQDGQPVYCVSDNGVGFDPAYIGKLFTPFQRLHTEAEFPGTGIGLALVQRVISKHGGRIWAEGEVDRGATFSFTLE